MRDRAQAAVDRSFVRQRKGWPPFEENEAQGGGGSFATPHQNRSSKHSSRHDARTCRGVRTVNAVARFSSDFALTSPALRIR
jgi:hypothetical protein